jgi:hypothetical protein
MNTIIFDTVWVKVGVTVQDLYEIANRSDRSMTVSIKMIGPAGGNPEITVTTTLDPSDLAIEHGTVNGHYFGT